MSSLPQSFVLITPRQLIYDNPKPNEPTTQFITLQNTLTYPITLKLKASNAFRYNLSETLLTLQPNESKQIDITLTLQQKTSATIKDTFQMKSDFFNDHITSTIIMSNHNNNDLEINSVQSTNDGNNDNDNDNSTHDLDLMSLTSAISDHKSTKSYIHTLEQNVSELKVELNYLKTVKSEINSQITDLETIVDATISKERALNEIRNKKVLMILQSKDETIENLKAMSKNYQQTETALNVLQKKHITLSQTLKSTKEQNDLLSADAKSHKVQMQKMNEHIASFKQQNDFQKKIINERELRINELTSDIEQTQKMLQKSTKTIKDSYAEQMEELKLKLNESQEQIQQITKEFDAHKIENKKNLSLCKQLLAENEDLKAFKAENIASFEHELKAIKDERCVTQKNIVQNVNALQIELAKLRSFVRLGMFHGVNESVNGKDVNKQIMDDLARKSAHLSASKAIIQQQRERINELEKLQKLSNKSCFDQSIKLSETNKKLTHSSSESNRLLAIHKRQIDILNKKLSNSIHCEEQSSIKLNALKQKLNHSETEYIEKIEELEEALQAINILHNQNHKGSDKRKKATNRHKKSDLISLENELFSTQNELKNVRKRLNSEMKQRQNDIKTYHLKLTNLKKLHEKQQNRTQSLINSKGHSKDANIARLIELNNELAQSEKLKNEYLTQLQCIKQEQQSMTNQQQIDEDNDTQSRNHSHNQHRLLMDQSNEIKELKDMLKAAVSVKNVFTCLHFECRIHRR